MRTYLLCTVLALSATQAFSATVGVGIARTTEFPGSDDATFIPTAEFIIATRIGIFKNEQVGVQLDLIKSGSFDTGPILRINTGRNDSVSDDVVAALPEIEASPEIGWFVGSGFRLANLGLTSNAIVIGRLSVVIDAGDGHGGTLINGSIGLVMQVTENLRFIPSVNFNYADDNYTQTFYGIKSDNESNDLTAFSANGGLESTQVALVGIRQINEQWSIKGTGAITTLQGDAAKSPITNRGSDRQAYTGFVVNYTF